MCSVLCVYPKAFSRRGKSCRLQRRERKPPHPGQPPALESRSGERRSWSGPGHLSVTPESQVPPVPCSRSVGACSSGLSWVSIFLGLYGFPRLLSLKFPRQAQIPLPIPTNDVIGVASYSRRPGRQAVSDTSQVDVFSKLWLTMIYFLKPFTLPLI